MAALLAACQNNDSVSNESETNTTLRMQASVSDVSQARTTSAADGHTAFVQDDKIGLFMPEENSSVCWTYAAGTGWKSETTLMWPNQRDAFDFCAYYPHREEATRASIPMPDLSAQTGKLENIGTFDFLTAKRSCKFTDNSGNVSFTAEYAFSHQYSLLLITLLKNSGDATTELKKATFEGSNAFGKHTYSFSAPEGMTAVPEALANKLELGLNEAIADEGSTQLAVLVNPAQAEQILKFSLSYQRDGISYTASTQAIKRAFASGVCYKYKIRIEKEQLSIVGSDIVGWTPEEIAEDIIIKDTPDTTE